MFGLTEPEHGSDATHMETRAVRKAWDGRPGWCIDGEKMWTTGMHTATHCMLFARTGRSNDKAHGISAFLVPVHAEGVKAEEYLWSVLDSFGGAGNREDRVLLAQVRGFFETHGASRFEDVGASIDQRVINRAGFYRTGIEGTREFLVLPEAFKRDVCAGFDQKAATQCLLAQGWVLPDTE